MKNVGPAVETLLPNGLRVVSLNLPEAKNIHMEIVVQVGAADDGDQKGLAHFLEHLQFAGTTKRTYEDISNAFTKNGGYFNAFTSWSQTVYIFDRHADADGAALRETVDIAADIFFDSQFPSDRLEHEREVILNETGERRDKDFIGTFSNAHFFKGSSFEEAVIGRMDFVKKATAQDFKAYKARKYCPFLTTAYVTSPVAHDQVMGEIAEKFAAWKPMGYQPEKTYFLHNPLDLRLLDPTKIQNRMQVFFVLPRADGQENWQKDILSRNMVDRAFGKKRNTTRMSYGVETFTSEFPGHKISGFTSYSRPHTSADYFIELMRWVSQIGDHLERDVFDGLKDSLSHIHNHEPVSNAGELARRLREFHQYGGNLYDHEAYKRDMSARRFEDIRDYAAACYARPAGMVVAGPEPGAVPSLWAVSEMFPRPVFSGRIIERWLHKLKPDMR